MNDVTPIHRSFTDITAEAEQQGGFCHELAHHALAYLPQSGVEGQHLVVSFGNLSTNRIEGEQHPWGHHLLRKQGWSILGLINKRNDWYRDPDLIAALETLRAEGLFRRFERVTFYGASMGGFGAFTFSRLSPGAHVVAFAPQSTLDTSIAPFETRYRYARKITDWTLPYGDAAEAVGDLASAHLFFDPFEPQDKAHAARLSGPTVQLHRLRHFGHKVPPVLLKLRLLTEVSLRALRGDISDQWLAQALRVRHKSVLYNELMLKNAKERGHYQMGLWAADLALQHEQHWKLKQMRKALRIGRRDARQATLP
ncbi:hypothetical protein [Thioclava sp. GXIMD4216]|uniref:Peptidase S9 prolyl oligopeptidase catalytic domain-containing protein n=1 Tax=Thioclava litoralis TaxID=3076557 RepID=A0ABZ1DWZ0_9RHOB|nr:hypothetical protein RPE78_11525 [Thioclava sp. FTW29]